MKTRGGNIQGDLNVLLYNRNFQMVKTIIRSSRGGVNFSAGKGNIPLLPAVKGPYMCR